MIDLIPGGQLTYCMQMYNCHADLRCNQTDTEMHSHEFLLASVEEESV